MADTVQQTMAPAVITSITQQSQTNQLSILNYPAGLGGFVDAVTNLAQANWVAAAGVSSTNTSQTASVPAAGSQQFYRLRFPYAWSWP